MLSDDLPLVVHHTMRGSNSDIASATLLASFAFYNVDRAHFVDRCERVPPQ
ncbi:hypothetical protein ACW9HM_05245 [Nocardia gipuzkoensis]|uniref:hypothetical protein n=1 Tax=Nocardia abscessus TaxID=120957 RepID=UPI00189447B0|nr:hypothetical protein [Nocardia abscessus]MBF6475291.1 hypothetical protein [Nocardia abscessus]